MADVVSRIRCRVILWILLAPFTVLADGLPTDVDARFAAMQAQIDTLNKRLDELQQSIPPRSPAADITSSETTESAAVAPPPSAPPHVQPEPAAAYQELAALRENWKQLQRGLSRAELHQLLGKPQSELAIDRQTLWYYRYPGIGSGSVMLDSKGMVTGWQKPPFRGW